MVAISTNMFHIAVMVVKNSRPRYTCRGGF
jgi:hypothetical protein